MIIDTSAIMAVLLNEPEAPMLMKAMVYAPRCAISAGSWIELAAVMTRRKLDLQPELDRLVAQIDAAIVPVTAEMAELGCQAYREFGIGSQHPARLNFGDCFAYALSKATGEPLLFKGDDFARTDVLAA